MLVAPRLNRKEPGSAVTPHLRSLKRYTSLYGLSMSLLNLPNELLQSISENLKSEKDINALVRTNRYLYNLLNPYLYRNNIRLFGSSALQWAAECKQEGTARKMLAEGADTEKTNEYGETPLLVAAMNEDKALVELLLAENGVNPDSKDSWGRTPLSWAAEMGNEEVVRLLLSEDNVDPNSVDSDERSPLSWAAEMGNEAVVKLLLSKDNIDPDSGDFDSSTPLSYAEREGHEAVVKLLLARNKVDPNSKSSIGRTPRTR
jgi:ankyrin repeat protein